MVFLVNLIEVGLCLQHLLDFNDRPDLGPEDKEMLIEDLVFVSILCEEQPAHFTSFLIAMIGRYRYES